MLNGLALSVSAELTPKDFVLIFKQQQRSRGCKPTGCDCGAMFECPCKENAEDIYAAKFADNRRR